MKLLVVTGARALDCAARPRRWALARLIEAFARYAPDVVVHGDARGPDSWAEDLALLAALPPRRWSEPQRAPVVRSPNGEVRPVKDVGAYPYGDPLSRNEAMIRWAANMAVSDAPAVRGPGHVVQVFGLLAPWSSTHGTAGTLLHARNMDLAVESISAPSEAWPEEDTAHGGQGA